MKNQIIVYWLHVFVPIAGWLAFGFWYILTNEPTSPTTPLEYVFSLLQFVWLLPGVYALTALFGLVQGPEKDKDELVPWYTKHSYPLSAETRASTQKIQNKTVNFVWVTRGDNARAVVDSVRETLSNCRSHVIHYSRLCPWFKFHVVTDKNSREFRELKKEHPFIEIVVVPWNFRPKNGAKYKARALEFWRQTKGKQQLLPDDFVLHLDEESVVTDSLFIGIHQYLDYFNPKNPEIGQGLITYNGKNFQSNIMQLKLDPSLVDTVRPGDDMGRFRFQYRELKRPLFGMHGSFILIPFEVLNKITWDTGGNSITEDAEFALLAFQAGYKFRWVYGTLREQSPFTLVDLMKQRKRWFTGLVQVVANPRIKWRTKSWLAFMIGTWSVSWLTPLVTITSMLLGWNFLSFALIPLVSLYAGVVMAVYFVGLHVSLQGQSFEPEDRFFIYSKLCFYLLFQIIPIVETAGILWALASPPRTFEVVDK